MTDSRRLRACTQAAGYLADAIGRKPVSEETEFPSMHGGGRERRKPVSERTKFVSAHCAYAAKTPSACTSIFLYLADDIGRKPVSERTEFVSKHCAYAPPRRDFCPHGGHHYIK